MSETNIATTGKTGTDHGLQADAQRLGQQVGLLREDLARIAKGAGAVAQSGVAAAEESGRETLATAKRKVDSAARSFRGGVSSHPGTVLGIAVGVGFLIGLVVPAILRSRRNALLLLLGVAPLLGFGMTGCSDDSTTVPPAEFAPPTSLRAINANEQIAVRWSPSPDEALSEFKRYNIYRGTASLLNTDAGQLEQLGYRVGSVDAGADSFRTTVANGTLYYFHVRAEKDNGDLSGASNEVQASGRPEGSGRIIEEFAADGNSGFDFSSGITVSLNQDNPDRFVLTDTYLGTGAEDDASTAVLSLKSPALLIRLNSEWADRNASVKFLGTDWDVNTTAADGFDDQLNILTGAVYAIKTPGGNYAKLKVEAMTGLAGSRSISFRYSYQTVPDQIQF